MGSISHVPHIVASALVNIVKALDTKDGKMLMLAAGGFKDITRIASSNPEMWENIISSNKDHITDILDLYIGTLTDLKTHINSGDSSDIYNFFNTARNYRNLFSSSRTGLINPINELVVDVIDKPGIIGEIATILGEHKINIKNISVSNSREFENGCLKISLQDPESVEKAFALLNEAGYTAYKND
jgi:prephenate dehydrogenase